MVLVGWANSLMLMVMRTASHSVQIHIQIHMQIQIHIQSLLSKATFVSQPAQTFIFSKTVLAVQDCFKIIIQDAQKKICFVFWQSVN